MTIRGWWGRYVAWRFKGRKAAYNYMWVEARRRAAQKEGRCTRCDGPRDSAKHKRCASCRQKARDDYNQRKAAKRAANPGMCSHCHKRRTDGSHRMCWQCRRVKRERQPGYAATAKAKAKAADMAPAA